MGLSTWRILVVALVAVSLFNFGVVFVVRHKQYFFRQPAAVAATQQVASIPRADLPQKLANPPLIIKAIYVTGYSAGSKKYLGYLANLFKTTQINAVVVDVKGSDGYVTYNSGVPAVGQYHLTNYAISDIDALVRFFHDHNIYVIGRIAVFEDPVFAKTHPNVAIYNTKKTTDPSNPVLWQNNGGLNWMDPASKDVWDYNISLAKDAFANGFDEVNFDYIRFPTDGAALDMGFPVWDQKTSMSDVIKTFFHYIRTSLPNETISADVFGQTTVSNDDMGIGQLIQNAFENFDYVSPMVYPSHYVNGFIGFTNPADHPYEVVKYSLDGAVDKENAFLQSATITQTTTSTSASPTTPVAQSLGSTNMVPLAKFRPWLQDFNLGAEYTTNPDMIDQQIKATEDSLGTNYEGFMLWNPNNLYTASAVLKPN